MTEPPEDPVIATGDSEFSRGAGEVESPRIGAGDRELLRSVATGDGLIPINAEQLEALANIAKATFDFCLEEAERTMTLGRAEFVRKLRVDEHYTWRGVAEACYLEWKGDWDPPSNQLMGMALCEVAAAQFGEDNMKDPWN